MEEIKERIYDFFYLLSIDSKSIRLGRKIGNSNVQTRYVFVEKTKTVKSYYFDLNIPFGKIGKRIVEDFTLSYYGWKELKRRIKYHERL